MKGKPVPKLPVPPTPPPAPRTVQRALTHRGRAVFLLQEITDERPVCTGLPNQHGNPGNQGLQLAKIRELHFERYVAMKGGAVGRR